MLDSRLIAFLTVTRFGSFTKAADHLGLSKARVSQQLTSLEQQLGVTLLHRSTRRLILTDAGKAYHQESARAATILEQAKQRLDDDQANIAGTVRINSVGGIFAERSLTPALCEFIKQYPSVELELDFSSNRVDLLAENYDLVFRMGKLEDSNLIARQLLTVRNHIVASPTYFNRCGKPDKPDQLIDYQCLCGSVKKWRFEHCNSTESIDVTVNGAISSANGHVLRAAALEGLGIVRLNHWYLDDDLAQGKLQPVFDDWLVPSQPLSLVYRQVKYQTQRVRLLADFLVAYFDKQ
ncbi:LysR family transcriptional regulator [Neiella marina]|uniref:LysR family transcriptional regulator n=1 Tax=Neiella marina TaxID=508461 RepID=A0A8J2U517_9GAMM|nr:LysR family transcriptional regulator [Neiella marina]GGA76778.1 LysR family transcriptional regulator [Neiella marina]